MKDIEVNKREGAHVERERERERESGEGETEKMNGR